MQRGDIPVLILAGNRRTEDSMGITTIESEICGQKKLIKVTDARRAGLPI
jgi:hypothetical protein